MARSTAGALRRALLCLPSLLTIIACRDSVGPDGVTDLRLARAVGAGNSHTCAVAGDHRTYCWGNNAFGQLGDSTNETRWRPVLVHSSTAFTAVFAGSGHTCALGYGGVAFCWGDNSRGQLGTGNTVPAAVPLQVHGGHHFRTLSLFGTQTCGVTDDGGVYCWGQSWFGPYVPRGFEPTRVEGLPSVVAVASGGYGTCALTKDGAVWCWGGTWPNAGGEPSQPTLVSGLPPAEAVAGGQSHVCVLGKDGAVYCWGDDAAGQLGNGPGTGSSTTPVPTESRGVTFTTLSLAAKSSCAITGDGQAYCWGSNSYGTLGNGSVDIADEPIPGAGSLHLSALSAGTYHACGVTVDGLLYCWGDNRWGQLGDGPESRGSTIPVLVRW